MRINKLDNFRSLFLCFFLLLGLSVQAQEDEKPKHWKLELAGALNNYSGWEVEPSVTYQPIRYIGLAMGFMFCNPISASGLGGLSQDKQWIWNAVDDDNGSHLFAFRPSLQFASPSIWIGKDKDYALYFSVSPGLTIPLQANREFNIEYFPNHAGTWRASKTEHIKSKGAPGVFYHIKSALSLEIDDNIFLSIGYTISNFDLYSGSRNMVIEGEKLELEKHRLMYSFSISMGFRL